VFVVYTRGLRPARESELLVLQNRTPLQKVTAKKMTGVDISRGGFTSRGSQSGVKGWMECCDADTIRAPRNT
jgi:hypothetical protein